MKTMMNRMDMSGKPMSMTMQNKKWLWVGGGIFAATIAWYLFRPELLFVNKTVNEPLPTIAAATGSNAESGTTKTLFSGRFHSGAHETKGKAQIHEIGNKRVLRLTGFETSNGPDVHVLMVADRDAADSKSVTSAGYVDLGSLKGNVGDQNYDLPADLDLSKYQAVTIWCNRFSVNFGTAPLAKGDTSMEMPMSGEPMTVRSGMFHKVAHDTKGTASILRLANNQHILRLTDFETSNGPDVRVYLGVADDAMDSETVKKVGFVEIGKLKGNIGDQNYEIPENIDLAKFKSVTVWCARFGVNFGTAPLK